MNEVNASALQVAKVACVAFALGCSANTDTAVDAPWQFPSGTCMTVQRDLKESDREIFGDELYEETLAMTEANERE